MSEFDIVSIGDTVTDAFIRLKDASVHCNVDNTKCEICMRFADKIPYEEVYVIPAVGNSANASVSAARLGLRSALVSNVGDDYFGQECVDALKKEHVVTDFIQVNKGMKTNYHYVLWYEADRTILVKHEKFDYQLPDIGVPRWVYLSSMGENSLQLHEAIADYLKQYPQIKLAFQPGTYQMKFGKEALRRIYEQTEVFFCNKEEAQRILETEESGVTALMKSLAQLGPKIVSITDGVNGAYAWDGEKAWSMPLFPDPKPPLQRTGAGDAFSSTFTVALALGKSIPEALSWGPINSMSVVQKIGARAGLLTRIELEEYLKNAPPAYTPQEISS